MKRIRVITFCAFIAACGFAPHRAAAQSSDEQLPRELEGVGITEHLDEVIPLDLRFKNESGQDVALKDYFAPGKPVILTLNFFRCGMLCNLTLNGLVDGLNDIEWSAGKEFQILTVSFNPAEGPELADVKKRAYLTQYEKDRATATAGWHFLTGDQANIDALCKAVGFGYRKLKDDDFAHSSTIMFLTPEGKLSRYMNDVVFQPRDLRLALVEASQGSIGSPMDKFLLYMCFQYDPNSNSYAASAMKIMRLGGAVTIVLMGAGFFMLWWRGSHARASQQHNQDQEHEEALA